MTYDYIVLTPPEALYTFIVAMWLWGGWSKW